MAASSLTRAAARRVRRALQDLQASIDQLLLAVGAVLWAAQHLIVRAIIDALTPRLADTASSWPRAAQDRLQAVHRLTPAVQMHVDRALAGLQRDLTEALRASGALGDVGARRFVEQAAGAWRTGMSGLVTEAQGMIAQQLAGLRDGTLDLPEATRRAAVGMIRRGVHASTLRDSAGRRWQPAAYAEMLLRTGAQQAHTAASLNAASETGTPYVVVSDAHRECDRCRPWERRVLRTDGTRDDVAGASLDEARAAGLFHPNCRHQVYPWWREWDDLPVPRGTADPAGYRASQLQRDLERGVRDARLLYDAHAATVGVNNAATRAAYADLRLARADLRAHVAEWEPSGTLKRSHWREVPRPGDIVMR